MIGAVLAGDARWHVEHGDCLAVLRAMPDESVDAVVTDPPYELGFMGKAWDASGIANSVAPLPPASALRDVRQLDLLTRTA